jgi:hypothetical protein
MSDTRTPHDRHYKPNTLSHGESCIYCGKRTLWHRQRHGVEVSVCFDCIPKHQAENGTEEKA